MRVNQTHSSMLISPARSIYGKVEHYKGSTLLNTFKHTDALSSFQVSRTAAKKFFGFGVTQALELKLVDKDRQITVEKDDILDASFEVTNDHIYPYPKFDVLEVTRDENSNQLTIKAVDKILLNADKHYANEITLTPPYSIQQLALHCLKIIGLDYIILRDTGTAFNRVLQTLNVSENDTIRSVLDDIAEATQTIYFQNGKNLVFKRLDIDGAAALTISKADYFTLSAKSPCVLNGIASVTELGDNVIATTGTDEFTQYVRDNALWNMRDDVGTLVEEALAAVGGTTITPFNCKWRGNYLLEIGDKIAVNTKDNGTITAYVLEEITAYNGGLNSTLSWEYDNSNAETPVNPSTLGEALKNVYAKVDKVNKEISLVVQEEVNKQIGSGTFDEAIGDAVEEKMSEIQIDTESIELSVLKKSQEYIDGEMSDVHEEMNEIRQEVSMTLSEEDVKILIENTQTSNAQSVTTATGYKFDQDGLTISRTGTALSTQITEDGMTIYRDDDEILVADNQGVKATNLHATTYLIVGLNSRFEDYEEGTRTGCFWIGG